jgi:D-alanine-D-alanine ligase
MDKKNIALVAGGYSSEYVVSLRSAESVFRWLDHDKFNIYKLVLTKAEWYAEIPGEGKVQVDKSDFSIEPAGRKIRFDAAYIIIHGTPGEDGKLQGYFEMLGIPCSTCGVLSASLSFNKHVTKTFLSAFNIPSAKAILLKKGDKPVTTNIIRELGLPCFVKPNNGGSSFGISKIITSEELDRAIEAAKTEDEEIIIESYLEGTELTCGLVKLGTKILVFPVTEVVPKNDFFDYEAKYTKGMAEEITPARIPDSLMQECQDTSAHIYEVLNCKGIVRIDYIYSKGTLNLLEVNTIPGMTETSFIPQQIRAMGMRVEDVVNGVVNEMLDGKG